MATKHFLTWVERKGGSLRRYMSLSPYEILDPFALAVKMSVRVLSLQAIPCIPQSIIDQLLFRDHSAWSAGCLKLAQGTAIIVYNPTHAITRQRATIMEELAHLHLRHDGSKLVSTRRNNGFRSYNKSEETQAYFVGAAALLPIDVLKKARSNHVSRMSLANEYIVSTALVQFRENITKVRLKS